MFLSFLAVFLIFQYPLHAYTDPGTGTLIWQLLMASFVGFLFYLRSFITWVKSLFSKNENQKE